jgi:hypothetical protein
VSSATTSRTCNGCGTQLPVPPGPGRPRKWCDDCKDSQRKRMRRAELAPAPTAWADEERAERTAWRTLADPRGDRKIFRPTLVSFEVDPEVLEVFIEESQGRAHHERHALRMVAA